MPRNQAHLPSARTKNRAPVRPPADLWEKIKEALGEVNPPTDSFTSAQCARNHGVTISKATYMIESLIKVGKVEVVGIWDERRYYRWVKP